MNILYFHNDVGNRFALTISTVGVLASFFEGTLGLQQLCAMTDLQLMIKFREIASDESLERHEIKFN